MDSPKVGKLTINELREEVKIVDPDTPISKVIGIMREWEVYEVFTQIGDKVGMISMRELLKVTNITTRKTSSTITYLPKISPQQHVGSIAQIMERYRVRALPIIEDLKITGQINAISIIKAMNKEHLGKYKMSNIMTGSPIVLSVDDDVTKARKMMVRRRIDHIPVAENGQLEGMVNSSQIVFKMLPSKSMETGALGLEKQNRLDFPLRRIMDKDPITCEVEARLSSVLAKMLSSNATYSIASLWGEIQGIVTYRDFLKLVEAEESSLSIPVYIVGLPEDPFEAEATRDKFFRTVGGLKKTFPEIIEARSIIKTKSIRSDRRRYEVNTILKTPYDTYAYSEGGYDLPSLYDVISDRMKRLMAQRHRKRRKHSSLVTEE